MSEYEGLDESIEVALAMQVEDLIYELAFWCCLGLAHTGMVLGGLL